MAWNNMFATVATVASVNKEREEDSRFLLRNMEQPLAGGLVDLAHLAPYPPMRVKSPTRSNATPRGAVCSVILERLACELLVGKRSSR